MLCHAAVPFPLSCPSPVPGVAEPLYLVRCACTPGTSVLPSLLSAGSLGACPNFARKTTNACAGMLSIWNFFRLTLKSPRKHYFFFFFFLSLFFLSLKESSLTASLLFAPRWRRAAVSPMLSLCCGRAMPPAPNSRAVIHTFGKRRSQSCSLLLFLLHNNNRGISYQLPPSLPFKE